MKKVLLCGFFILLSSTLVHGIICYNCSTQFKDSCQGKAVECDEYTDRCMTESVYSKGGEFRGVYTRCAKGIDNWRCCTILIYASEVHILNCCFTDRCNGKRSPFISPKCAKPTFG